MEATETNFLWLSIAYGILFIAILCGFVRVVYNTITTERKRKKFTPVMVKGDAVYFPVASGSVNGEILEVDRLLNQEFILNSMIQNILLV